MHSKAQEHWFAGSCGLKRWSKEVSPELIGKQPCYLMTCHAGFLNTSFWPSSLARHVVYTIRNPARQLINPTPSPTCKKMFETTNLLVGSWESHIARQSKSMQFDYLTGTRNKVCQSKEKPGLENVGGTAYRISNQFSFDEKLSAGTWQMRCVTNGETQLNACIAKHPSLKIFYLQ